MSSFSFMAVSFLDPLHITHIMLRYYLLLCRYICPKTQSVSGTVAAQCCEAIQANIAQFEDVCVLRLDRSAIPQHTTITLPAPPAAARLRPMRLEASPSFGNFLEGLPDLLEDRSDQTELATSRAKHKASAASLCQQQEDRLGQGTWSVTAPPAEISLDRPAKASRQSLVDETTRKAARKASNRLHQRKHQQKRQASSNSFCSCLTGSYSSTP